MTAPSAVGTLAKTPLAHALIYARNRRLTGRLELTAPDDRHAVISIWHGQITMVETTPVTMCPGGFFGAVAYELGFIETPTLDATLLEIASSKRLHGEVLTERQAITAAQRDEVLVEQVHRKVHHLASLPETTSYAFYEATSSFEPSVAVDPIGPVWRGIRDFPPMKFVEETVRRIGDNALRLTAGGAARLPSAETALAQALAERPMTLPEMKDLTDLPPSRVELLVYLLVIAKCVEAVSGVRTHPSTGPLPYRMPSGPVSIPVPGPGPSSERTSPPSWPSGTLPSRIPVAPVPSTRFSSTRPPTRFSSTRPPTSSMVPSSRPTAISSTIPVQRVPSWPPGHSSPSDTLGTLLGPAEIGIDGIVARAATIDHENYFEVLGVSDGASSEVVRAAFIRLAKSWHPDRLPPDLTPVRGEVAKIFATMTRAQQLLCDDDARRVYVASRTPKKPAMRPRAEVARELAPALGRRDFERAVLLCEELISMDAEDTEALAVHAWASIQGGEDATDEMVRAALAKIDKAVNLDRTSGPAIYYRGLAHKRLGNIPAAFRDFARALQLNPKHVEAEREVRILAMRARKGSGERRLVAPLLEKLGKK